MSYIGNIPTTVAFLVDTFSGNGSTTAFTLSQAPANTSSILVAVSGVVQDPSTYSVSGTTLTFSGAPPSGSSNISVRFLGIPASGVATTAYRTVTEFTATSGQTTFSVPSYTAGYIDVYRNGVMLGSADYTATNGTTVVLNNGCTAGDLVEVISFQVSSVLNAIPGTAGSVGTTLLADNSVTTAKIADGAVTRAKMAASGAWAPAGTVLQVVNATYAIQTDFSTASYVDTGLTATITPTSASSRILVLVNQSGLWRSAGSPYGELRLVRNSTALIRFVGEFTTPDGASGSTAFLDSPATTSATIYKTQCFASGASVQLQRNSGTSTITLLEIAG